MSERGLPTGLTTAFGGPLGARVRSVPRGSWAWLAPIIALLVLPLSLGALRQAGCAAGSWDPRVEVWRQCESTVMGGPVIGSEALGGGSPTAVAIETMTAPVSATLDSLVIAAVRALAPGAGSAEQRWALVIWAALAAAGLAFLVMVVASARAHPRARPVVLALSPVIALTVFSSPALAGVCLAVLAVWAQARGRDRLAGVAAGASLLAGWPALAVVGTLAIAALLGGDRSRRFLIPLVGTASVLGAAVLLLDPSRIIDPVTAWWSGGAGAGSPWLLPTLAGFPTPGPAVALVASVVAALALWVSGGMLRAGRPVGEAALVALIITLAGAAAAPPAVALWLVPFVALAGIGWRDHLLWAGAEAIHAAAYFGWLTSATGSVHGLAAPGYVLALLIRVLAMGWLAWTLYWRPGSAAD